MRFRLSGVPTCRTDAGRLCARDIPLAGPGWRRARPLPSLSTSWQRSSRRRASILVGLLQAGTVYQVMFACLLGMASLQSPHGMSLTRYRLRETISWRKQSSFPRSWIMSSLPKTRSIMPSSLLSRTGHWVLRKTRLWGNLWGHRRPNHVLYASCLSLQDMCFLVPTTYP